MRAASVFGEVFWRGGVGSLLAGGLDAADLDDWLDTLTQRELIIRVPEGRFPGEREYAFRHGLLREAAYAMLTETDRAMGHRLAGDWLEAAGEKDARTMADHFESGGQPRRALPWLVRGSQAAVDAGNLKEGQALGLRGMACGAEGVDRGALTQALGGASYFQGDLLATVELLGEAMRLVPNGSTRWFQSAAAGLFAALSLDDPALAAPFIQAITTVPVEPEPTGHYATAVCGCCFAFVAMGQVETARSLVARAEAIEADPEALFVQHLGNARGLLDLVDGTLGRALARLTEARRASERSGRGFGHAITLQLTIAAAGEVGRYDRAEALFREQVAFCEPRRIHQFIDWARFYFGLSGIHTGHGAAAREGLAPLLTGRNRIVSIGARAYIAQSLAQEGDLESAEREARTSLDGGARAVPLGALALVELRRSRPAEALVLAEKGLRSNARSPWPSTGSFLHLTRAGALHALGRTDDARHAIREARDRIVQIAATLDGDPELRASYLKNILPNARTLELAKEWGGEDPAG